MLVAIFRINDANHFNLVELVLTDHTAGVTTVGTGFRTEARRMGRDLDREFIGAKKFAAYHVGQGNFRGRDQVHAFAFTLLTALLRSEKIFFKLRQLSGAAHRLSRNNIRRIAFNITVITGVRIQHELS